MSAKVIKPNGIGVELPEKRSLLRGGVLTDVYKLGVHFFDAVSLFNEIHPDVGIDLRVDLTAFIHGSGEVFHKRKMRIGFPVPGLIGGQGDELYLRPERGSD